MPPVPLLVLQELIDHAQSDQDTDTNQQNIDLCFQGDDILLVSIDFMSCFGGGGIRRVRFYQGFVEVGTHGVSVTLPAEYGKILVIVGRFPLSCHQPLIDGREIIEYLHYTLFYPFRPVIR